MLLVIIFVGISISMWLVAREGSILYWDISLSRHFFIPTWGNNLHEFRNVLNIFLLKSFIFLPTLYYLCFILYYFITSYVINIKNGRNKKAWGYRSWIVHGFSCVYLMWFLAPKWYFVWPNWGMWWCVDLRLLWNDLAVTMWGSECEIWLFWRVF